MAGKKISEIMTKRLETVSKDTSLAEVTKLMKEKSVRHLLVLERATGNLLGLVSDRDIKKYISPFIGSSRATPQDNATAQIEVGKIMIAKDKIVAASPDDDVKSIVEKMLIKKFGCVPVIEKDGRAVGIVTRSDLMKLLLALI